MIRQVSGVMLDPESADFLVRALELLAETYRGRGIAPSAKLIEVTEQLRSGANAGATQAISGTRSRFVDGQDIPTHDHWHAILNSRQAADILGITPNGARDLARRRTLPARRAGREWLFDATAVIRRAETSSR